MIEVHIHLWDKTFMILEKDPTSSRLLLTVSKTESVKNFCTLNGCHVAMVTVTFNLKISNTLLICNPLHLKHLQPSCDLFQIVLLHRPSHFFLKSEIGRTVSKWWQINHLKFCNINLPPKMGKHFPEDFFFQIFP